MGLGAHISLLLLLLPSGGVHGADVLTTGRVVAQAGLAAAGLGVLDETNLVHELLQMPHLRTNTHTTARVRKPQCDFWDTFSKVPAQDFFGMPVAS